MAGRFNLEAAYILHRREYRDTSYLLDIWSENHGRISLVARGARGARGLKSRFQGLQPFHRLLLSWSGRGELGTLTAVESEGLYLQLSGQFAMSGFYLNELLTLLLHKDDPHPELFILYECAMNELARLSTSNNHTVNLNLEEEKILRQFEKGMLDTLGYGINFEFESESDDEIKESSHYTYNVMAGFVKSIEPNKKAYLGKNLLAIAREQFDDTSVLKDAKRIMRSTLDCHLGGKPLKSRELRLAMAKEARC